MECSFSGKTLKCLYSESFMDNSLSGIYSDKVEYASKAITEIRSDYDTDM